LNIDDNVWAKAIALRQQYASELNDPRCFTRFLCGVTSPKLQKAKLQKDPLFGALADVPFPTILARAEKR
jgi:ATP-dependent DNA helicase RecQ